MATASSEAELLFRPVVERLYLLSQKYKSTYLFVHEISLHELLCLIIRQCLDADDPDNCCQDVKVDRERIDKLFYAHVMKVKGEWVIHPQTRKMVTLRSVLEQIRSLDITGQLLQCMGLLHLWCQYRSKPLFTRITSSDILVFHHFIQGYFGHVLQSAILQPENADGIVYLVKNFTLDTFNEVIDQVDRAIVKFVFNWPRQIPADSTEASGLQLIPKLASKSENNKLKTVDEDGTKLLVYPEQLEALGRIYLNDYMFRRHVRLSESSMSQTDFNNLNSRSLVNQIEPTICLKFNKSQLSPSPLMEDPKSSVPSKDHSADDNRMGCAIDTRISYDEKRLLLAKFQAEIKTMAAFLGQPENEAKISLSSLDSYNLSVLESHVCDDDEDNKDGPSKKTLQLMEALINVGGRPKSSTKRPPPLGKDIKCALPLPPRKTGQGKKSTKAPLPQVVVNSKVGTSAKEKSINPTECSESNKSAKAFKDDVFGQKEDDKK